MPTWWFSPRVWFLIGSVVVGLTALVLAWFLQREGLDRADKWASVVFGFVSALAVAAGTLAWLWRLGRASGDDAREAALSRLAAAQRDQWTAEQAARRVRDPWPLNVRWVASARAQAVMPGWASVRGTPGAGPVQLDGDYGDIVTVLGRDDVPRRLIVLGEPGAGKSMVAIHLTLQLLERRAADGPVPVLMTAAGWNPVQPLDAWVADQLLAADRRLAAAAPGSEPRRTLAHDLVARGLIMPVLDGLDELDDGVQRAALIRMSAAAAAGREFVVTCRTRPFEAAVRACGPIPAAIAVELQPVPAAEAAQHLADSAAMGDARWVPVVAHLTSGRTTPLTEALSRPLMIWLARMVYQGPDRDPAELLAADRAGTREAIEEHLLDHLIPAAYAVGLNQHPPRPAEVVERTRQWLALVGDHMRRHKTYDFAWRQLSEVGPAPVAHLVSVAGVIFVVMAAFISSILLSMPVVFPDGPVDPWLSALFLGVWAGIFVAFARLLFTDRHHPRRITLRGLRTVFLAVATLPAVIGVVAGHPAFGFAVALAAGAVAALASGAEPALSAASPSASLRADRTATLVAAVTVGAATAVVFAVSTGPAGWFTWAAAVAMAGAAILLNAWGQLQVAQVALAVVHGTPVRLVRDMAEACDRGVLRRAGGAYQFRHGLLRNRVSAAPADVR